MSLRLHNLLLLLSAVGAAGWGGEICPLALFSRNSTQLRSRPAQPPSALTALIAAIPAERNSPCPLPYAAKDSGANAMIEQTYNFVTKKLPLRAARPGSSSNVAVLIEPRLEGCLLPYVVKNVMHFLGKGWQLQIFHGTHNLAHMQMHLNSGSDFKNIIWTNTFRDNFVDGADYSRYVASSEFWKQVQGENVLMFQLDSFLLRGGIDEFLQYDYVGAPWRYCELPAEGAQDHLFYKTGINSWCWQGGNGGLSFRKKSKMLQVLQEYPYSEGFPPMPNVLQRGTLPEWIYQTFPEDVYFTINLPKIGAKLPDRDVAKGFAVESIYHDAPFGVHAAWKYLSPHLESMLFQNMQYEATEEIEFEANNSSETVAPITMTPPQVTSPAEGWAQDPAKAPLQNPPAAPRVSNAKPSNPYLKQEVVGPESLPDGSSSADVVSNMPQSMGDSKSSPSAKAELQRGATEGAASAIALQSQDKHSSTTTGVPPLEPQQPQSAWQKAMPPQQVQQEQPPPHQEEKTSAATAEAVTEARSTAERGKSPEEIWQHKSNIVGALPLTIGTMRE